MDKSRQRTIRGKFLRITIPLIFLTVIGVFSVVELMTHKNAIDQLHETLAGMIATQSAALATPVWNLDRAGRSDQGRRANSLSVSNERNITS